MTRDEELSCIARVRAGDAQAFEPLVEENQSRVYSIALRMMGNEADAADAAQEAFIKAYGALDSFRGESRFSSWLSRLTTNVCVDLLRRRKRSAALSLSELGGDEEEPEELPIPDLRFAPELMLERKELRRALSRALERLPVDARRILVLRELGGLSYEELGAELGLESGTVKSRLNRARRRLCEILLQDGNFSGLTPSKKGKGGGQP